MRVDSFCANPGESFSFIDDTGQPWKGVCSQLRPAPDETFQFRGILHKGPSELIDTEICGNYDPKTESLELL